MSKPKSILFHYPTFNIGGAEKSIVRLTKALCDNGWKVTIVLTTGKGNYESAIDRRITIVYLRPRSAGAGFKNAIGLNKLNHLADLSYYLFFRLIGALKMITFRLKKYDVAVISLHGLSPLFVCKFVRSKYKSHWIRSDLSYCDTEEKATQNISKYNLLVDYYICVSKTVLESLVLKFPDIANKSHVVHNIIDAAEMLDKASELNNPLSKYNSIKVITVCRLSEKSKGLLRMVQVHRRLKEDGIIFNWFILGNGPDLDLLKVAIKEFGLEKDMILLGRKNNPFPYFKSADISATLSYFEGLCGTINEAKVMGLPVIATEFSGINEQIINNKTGLIVKNDEDSIFRGLKSLLTDTNLRNKLSNNHLPDAIMNDNLKVRQIEELFDK